MNLSVDIAGVTMKNPVTTGSGTLVQVKNSANLWTFLN